MANHETIGSLGENATLARIVPMLASSAHSIVGSGDDSAVISAPDSRFVVTTDTLVEEHDFRLDWSTGYDLGFKAVASNIADIAAMGAVPTSLVVALVAPADTTVAWCEDFARGLRDGCQSLAPGCGVVGGDLASGPVVMVSVAAHGDLEGRAPVLRSGAKPGDVLAVAGTLGQAAAGLALLQSGNQDAIATWDDWVNIQRRPNPPIALGVAAASAGATAMLDISDGLARDAARIARASGVEIQIDRRQLQGFEAVIEGAAQWIDADAFDWVLRGGEDHSLLATFAADAALPRGFKAIGRVLGTSETPRVLLDDQPIDDAGWDSVRG